MPTGQVRTENELLDLFKDNTTRDINPVDLRDFVVTMFYEVAAVTGVSSYVYIAYADDGSGTGFTMAFSPTKDYIAILNSLVFIPSPIAGNFSGLWTKYRGDQGVAGNTILSGLVDPTGLDGVDGDFFINTVSYDIFGPKAAGVWGAGTSLIGPTGPVSNGTQLGSGTHVFKTLNGSNLEFRSLKGDTHIVINELTDVAEFIFSYITNSISVTSILTDWTTSASPNAGLVINSFNDSKIYKFSGGLKYTGASPGVSSGSLLFVAGLTLTRDTFSTAVLVDSSGNFKQQVCIKIASDGKVTNRQSITISPNDYLSFEDTFIFNQ